MLVTIHTGARVAVGSAQYRESKAIAERLAMAEPGAVCRWADDYNDYSATGRFVVTGRRPMRGG